MQFLHVFFQDSPGGGNYNVLNSIVDPSTSQANSIGGGYHALGQNQVIGSQPAAVSETEDQAFSAFQSSAAVAVSFSQDPHLNMTRRTSFGN